MPNLGSKARGIRITSSGLIHLMFEHRKKHRRGSCDAQCETGKKIKADITRALMFEHSRRIAANRRPSKRAAVKKEK